MARRFTDTEKFNDSWYRKLTLLQRSIWEFLLAECNHAGILEKFDIDIISFKIGVSITLDDVKSLGNRIIFVTDEILFIPNFIKFQYNILNPQNKVHASVLRILEKYNLQAPCKVLKSPLLGSKDKDKDKDKDKSLSSSLVLSSSFEKQSNETEEARKEENLQENFSFSALKSNPDLMFDANIQKAFDIYKKECKNLIPLGFEPKNLKIRQKVFDFLNLISGDFAYFENLCQKANDLKIIVKRKIDFQMMLNNHERIVSGFYKTQKQEENTLVDEIYKQMGVNSE